MGVVEMELGPGFPGPPEHRHLEFDHLWYVVAGRVDILVDGERFDLAPGDFAFVPRGIARSSALPPRSIRCLLCPATEPRMAASAS
jgi:mannose-6-phosphate isomerase-like protein (cupin superfamily)